MLTRRQFGKMSLATPESFAAAMRLSRYFKVNLDIGHFTAANFDAVAYIREHHANITNLHLKDRKKNQGDSSRTESTTNASAGARGGSRPRKRRAKRAEP